MITPIYYSINEQKFDRRVDLLKYLIKNDQDISQSRFACDSFPNAINTDCLVEPDVCTYQWLKKLREKNKPIVLMFSGGVDSAFALKNMIYHDFPPDYVLIYTLDPFDDEDYMSPYNMETKLAIEYFEHLKKNNKILNYTKLWHIHLNSKYANRYFDNYEWPMEISNYHYSLDTMAPWTDLIEIPNPDDFIFIKGGDFPKFIHSSNESHFYIVDLQLSDIDSKNRRCYDYILDNNDLLKCFAAKIAKKQKQYNTQNMSYNKEMGEKYLLNEFHNLTFEIPPQLDKRFNSSLPNYSDNTNKNFSNIGKWLNKKNLKSWLLYLRAEEEKPNWYKKYKESIDFYEEWITTTNSISGLITTPVPVNQNHS
jgi:hypothetical protein